MRPILKQDLRYPNLSMGCIGAWSGVLGPTGTLMKDLSGFNRNCTFASGATSWEMLSRKHTRVFTLFGAYGTTNCVPPTGAEPRTISYWYRTSDETAINRHLSYGEDTAGKSIIMRNGWSGSFWTMQCEITGTTINGGTTIAANTLYHICLLYTGTKLSIWTNGVQGSETTTTLSTTSANALKIGGWYTAGNTGFTGYMDDIRVYNRALDSSEIKNLAKRRYIASEMISQRNRSYKSSHAFRPAWAFQRSQILSSGVR